MRRKPDYYEVLGVSRTATHAEIQSAFRRRARELHPDVNPSPDATRRFQELNQAYRTLFDPAQRAAYDRITVDPPVRRPPPPTWTQPPPRRKPSAWEAYQDEPPEPTRPFNWSMLGAYTTRFFKHSMFRVFIPFQIGCILAILLGAPVLGYQAWVVLLVTCFVVPFLALQGSLSASIGYRLPLRNLWFLFQGLTAEFMTRIALPVGLPIMIWGFLFGDQVFSVWVFLIFWAFAPIAGINTGLRRYLSGLRNRLLR